MSAPVVGSVAQRVYQDMAPVAWDDANHSFALLVLCGALGVMFQPVADLVSDTDDGPGWSQLVDVDRTPAGMLGYLGQFVGVTLRAGLDDTAQRQRIRDTAGMKRGTTSAIVGAAQQYLTGTKTVIVRERFNPSDPTVDHAYHLQVITFTAETPDSTAVQNAIVAQKPAGLILHYSVLDGQDFELVRENFATLDALRLGYTTFDQMRTDTP